MPSRPIPTRHLDLLALHPGRWARASLVALAVFLALVVPMAIGNRWIGASWVSVALEAQIFVVGAVGLMLLTGVTGQISLGHAGFLAVGGFTAAAAGVHWGLPWWLVLPLAGTTSALVGLLVGPFALRLKGLYLAIVTLGLVFIIQHVLLRWTTVSGGTRGTAVPMWGSFVGAWDGGSVLTSRGAVGAQSYDLGILVVDRNVQIYLIFLAITVTSTVVARNILRTRTGRAMAAVGGSDVAAAVLGIEVGRVKSQAFALSSFYAGMAGAMLAWKQTFLTVNPPFDLHMSMEFVAMIFVGGIGTVLGAVVGALLFALGRPLAARLAESPLVESTPLQEGDVTLLVFSVAVVLFIVFEPQGLRGIWLRIRRYFTTWPVGR